MCWQKRHTDAWSARDFLGRRFPLVRESLLAFFIFFHTTPLSPLATNSPGGCKLQSQCVAMVTDAKTVCNPSELEIKCRARTTMQTVAKNACNVTQTKQNAKNDLHFCVVCVCLRVQSERVKTKCTKTGLWFCPKDGHQKLPQSVVQAINSALLCCLCLFTCAK